MPTQKPVKPNQAKSQPRKPSAFEKAANDLRQPANTSRKFQQVSPRWLLGAATVVVLAALACGWLTLCFLYWTGNWQLLYHPKAAITRTPAGLGLPFEVVKFATTESGKTQLTGWWLPNPIAGKTALYLHRADGNLSDTVNTLAALHHQGLSVFAFDYRGYGQSQPLLEAGHPSEKQLRQDAEWALTWLTLTRNIPSTNIVVIGSGLGATLGAELAADHPELAGVILDQPRQDALAPVFNDDRSRLVPAHWLVKDRYDLTAAAQSLKIPSLWLLAQPEANLPAKPPEAYKSVQVQKTMAWLNPPTLNDPHLAETLRRWLDELPQTPAQLTAPASP